MIVVVKLSCIKAFPDHGWLLGCWFDTAYKMAKISTILFYFDILFYVNLYSSMSQYIIS